MEAFELESLLTKSGGKYKLVTMCQKRMRELQRGLPRLVEIDSTNLWDIVSKEIMDGKVELLMGDDAEQARKELAIREAEEAAGDGEKKATLPKPEEAKN
jgi:DNA-directed RNA polymerase subunit K/omega